MQKRHLVSVPWSLNLIGADLDLLLRIFLIFEAFEAFKGFGALERSEAFEAFEAFEDSEGPSSLALPQTALCLSAQRAERNVFPHLEHWRGS